MTTAADWIRCRPWIEASAAVAPFPLPIEEYERRIATGEFQFWPSANCAAITEVAFFEGRKTLVIRCGGGDLKELLGYVEPALCVVAKSLGCDAILSEGRKGWERPAIAHGYKFAWVTMIKEL